MTDIEYSRKDRSISSWISMGSMPDGDSSGVSLSGGVMFAPASSDVEEAHVLGVLLDEAATQFDVVAHEY